MTKTANVIPGGTLLTAWGNEVRDRSIQIFASAAERDSAYPTPVRGQTCYIASNDVVEGFYCYDGTAWRPPWNTAWGVISQASTSTPQATSSAGIYSDSLAVSWTGIAGRLYKVTFAPTMSLSVTQSPTFCSINTGASGLNTVVQEATLATVQNVPCWVNHQLVTFVTGTGLLQYHGRFGTSAGTITLSYQNRVSWMVAEDVGPIGVPA